MPSHTPRKTKFARAKSRAKRLSKHGNIPSGSTRGGTKQEAVLALLREPKGATIAAIMARPKGQPKLGGRQKGTKNHVCPDLKQLCRTYTNEAVRLLARIMRAEHESMSVRGTAATALLDRGWGRPGQAISATVSERDERLAAMTEDELNEDISRLIAGHEQYLKEKAAHVDFCAAHPPAIEHPAGDTSRRA